MFELIIKENGSFNPKSYCGYVEGVLVIHATSIEEYNNQLKAFHFHGQLLHVKTIVFS